jgi:hypothetical protein
MGMQIQNLLFCLVLVIGHQFKKKKTTWCWFLSLEFFFFFFGGGGCIKKYPFSWVYFLTANDAPHTYNTIVFY